MNNKTDRKKRQSHDPLRAFYESYATPDRDMTILEGAPRTIPPLLAIAALLLFALLAGAAWIGYQYMNGGDINIIKTFGTSDNRFIDVRFDLDRDSVVANGTVTATLTIKNVGANPIDRLSASMTFPDGFHYIDASPVLPKNEQHTYWELGVLKSNEQIDLAIQGRMVSEDESEKEFEALVYYQPVNLSSEFKAQASASVLVKRSPFRLRIEGPHTVEQGKTGTYQIKYHESAERYTVPDLSVVRPLKLRVIVPPVLQNVSAVPQPSSAGFIWDLSELENSRDSNNPDTRIITLTGGFSATPDAGNGITASIGYESDIEFIVLDETLFVPQVVAPEEKNLSLRLLIDGSDGVSLPFTQTGDNATHTIGIEFENKGAKTFLDTAVRIVIPASPYLLPVPFDSPMQEPRQIVLDAEHGVSADITSEAVPILAALAPGEKGAVSIRVRTLDPITYRSLYEQGALSNVPDTIPIRFSAEIGGILSSAGEKEMLSRTVAEKTITIQFDSDTSLALRHDVRSDPVTATTFEWSLENTRHALSGITVKTVLSPAAMWSSQTFVSAGEIRYMPDTREVVWSINRLPEGVRAVSARFTVEGDLSSALPSVIVHAKDTVTGGTVLVNR